MIVDIAWTMADSRKVKRTENLRGIILDVSCRVQKVKCMSTKCGR